MLEEPGHPVARAAAYAKSHLRGEIDMFLYEVECFWQFHRPGGSLLELVLHQMSKTERGYYLDHYQTKYNTARVE